MAPDNETLTLNRVAYRFIPFLMLCYFVAYLDRVNVGFAKLTMDPDLGLSDTAFGFGAGVFFLSYFLFEVPSNVILDRVGARIWIARIMFSWGIVSGAMAFIPQIASCNGLQRQSTPSTPFVFFLGSPRRDSFPGIIFFLTLWFPASYRGAHRRLFHGGDSALGRRLVRQSRRRCLALMAPPGFAAGNGCSSSRRCRRFFSPSSSISI